MTAQRSTKHPKDTVIQFVKSRYSRKTKYQLSEDSVDEIFKIKNYKPYNVYEYYKIEKENLAARRSNKHTKDKPIVKLKAVPAKDGRLYNFIRETLPSDASEYIKSKGKKKHA